MQAAELRAITERTVGPLERGVMKEQMGFTDMLGEGLQLRTSSCGIATAALQKYLLQKHDVVTKRIIVDLPRTTLSMQTRHVFLRHGRTSIDPSYSQFFEYADLSALDLIVHPELDESLYPDTKIAVIEDTTVDRFIAEFAAHAISSSRQASLLIGEADSVLPSLEELKGIYKNVWSPLICKVFPVAPGSPIDEAAERIVEGIGRELSE